MSEQKMREGQEPVAWGVVKRGERVWYVNDSRSVCIGYAQHYEHRDANGSDQSVIPLYTTPPAAPVPDRLHEIVNGQWWINELLSVFESGDWSVEQRTALNVVVEMTRLVEEMLAASKPEVK